MPDSVSKEQTHHPNFIFGSVSHSATLDLSLRFVPLGNLVVACPEPVPLPRFPFTTLFSLALVIIILPHYQKIISQIITVLV